IMNRTITPSLKMEDLVHAYDLLGARNGEQAECNSVQDREDSDIDPDTEGDRQCRRYGEPRTAPQCARAETNVLKQLPQPGDAPHFARPLLDVQHVAEFAQGRVTRLFRRHAPIDVVLRFH